MARSIATLSEGGELVSPPRGWPACFKESASLKAFLGRTLKARKCRLVEPPPDDIAAEIGASAVRLAPDESTANAERVGRVLGWPIVRGFAIFELGAHAGEFVARERWWNVHPESGIWVDPTPRNKGQAQLVLVEADVESAIERSERPLPPPAAPAESAATGGAAPAAAEGEAPAEPQARPKSKAVGPKKPKAEPTPQDDGKWKKPPSAPRPGPDVDGVVLRWRSVPGRRKVLVDPHKAADCT